MDFAKPFTFIFEDPDWLKKVAMLALIGFAQLVPILGSIFMGLVFTGLTVEIVRKVINKEALAIPALDINKQFMDGLKMFVINFVYSLPITVLGALIGILYAIAAVTGVVGSDSDFSGGSTAVMVLLFLVGGCFLLLILLYGLLLALITPEIYARYAQHGTIGSSLKFKEVFQTALRKPVPYLLSFVGVAAVGIVSGIASSILSAVGAIALGVGALYGMALALVFAALASGHFYGQAHNLGTETV